jgi:magnesium-transporting ATPase (P-type)
MNIISSQMWFNMFGQALFQLIVTLILLFNGHLMFWYDESNVESAVNDVLLKQQDVFPGSSDQQLRLGWFAGCEPSQQYTMLFNAFVMMTLFNQFSSRKLRGETNFFEGITGNKPFMILCVIEFVLQFLFVQYSGAPAGSYGSGITGGQWGWCILFGFFGWVWQFVINTAAQKFPSSTGLKKAPFKTIDTRRTSDQLVKRLSVKDKRRPDHDNSAKTEHNENMVRQLSNSNKV